MNIDFSKAVDYVSEEEVQLVVRERLWREAELNRADVEVNKLQDGMKSGLTLAQWRAYRVELRNWPENTEFPSSDFRPVAPDRQS